jgi:hypothetical protein
MFYTLYTRLTGYPVRKVEKRWSCECRPRTYGISKSIISYESPYLLGRPSFFNPSVDIQKDPVGPNKGPGRPELTVWDQLERNRPPVSSSVPACLGTLCARTTNYYHVLTIPEASQAPPSEKRCSSLLKCHWEFTVLRELLG